MIVQTGPLWSQYVFSSSFYENAGDKTHENLFNSQLLIPNYLLLDTYNSYEYY